MSRVARGERCGGFGGVEGDAARRKRELMDGMGVGGGGEEDAFGADNLL